MGDDNNIAAHGNGEKNRPRLLVIFNHNLTATQIEDAWSSLGISEILEPAAELRNLWADIPPQLDNLAVCREFTAVRDWLKAKGRPGDYALIQGDFGATYLMVRFALEQGIVPIYSTTRRQAVEHHNPGGDIDITHSFRHVGFRRYQPELPAAERRMSNGP